MTELLTAAQMRAIEQAAIASGEVTGLELMERAGQGVVEAIFEEWPEFAEKPHKVVILCGPGNNGGDGFVVARLLKEAGWKVAAFLYGDPDKLPQDAKVNYKKFDDKVIAFKIDTPPLADDFLKLDFQPDVMVDALFGIGLSRPMKGLAGLAASANHWMRDLGMRLVALDIPSGILADTGEAYGQTIKADLTVTFHQKKRGHEVKDGPMSCGKVVVKDIGL